MDIIEEFNDFMDGDEDQNDLNMFNELLINDVEENLLILISMEIENRSLRSSSFFCQRWNSEYLTNFATVEGSFVAEYRVDPGALIFCYSFFLHYL